MVARFPLLPHLLAGQSSLFPAWPAHCSRSCLVSVMPIYEYRCPKCQKIFEEWSHISDDHPTEPCPDCSTPSPRIMSSTSFVLEGSGWYVTDYGYRKGVKDDSSSGSSSAGSKDSGTAGKPAEAKASEPAAKPQEAAKPAAPAAPAAPAK